MPALPPFARGGAPAGTIDTRNPVEWSHPLNRGLVSWWLPFGSWSGGGTLRDLCLRNNGTLTNGPTWTAGRLPGLRAVTFDGTDDYVNVGNPSSLAITSYLTVACWFRIHTYTASTRPHLMGVGYNGNKTGYALGFNQVGSGVTEGTGRLCFITYDAVAVRGSYTSQDFSSGTNVWYHAVGTWDGTLWNTYVNGVPDRNSESTQTVAPQSSAVRFFIGSQDQAGSPVRPFDGDIADPRVMNRALSAGEVYALYDQSRRGHPDTIRRIRPWSFGVGVAASGSPYAIAAGSGSYALTGTAVALRHASNTAAGSGTYALTGTAVALGRGYPLAAGAGSYTLTGSAVGLKAGRQVAAGSGSYTLSGTAAGLAHGYKVAAGAGSYSLSGTAVALTYSGAGAKVLAADSGTYSLTGTAAALTHAARMAAGSGSYALTGNAAGLGHGYKVAAGAGSYSQTGSPVALQWVRRVAADSGSYALSGTAVTLTYTGAAPPTPSTGIQRCLAGADLTLRTLSGSDRTRRALTGVDTTC